MHIVVIHHKTLKNRVPYINGTLDKIKQLKPDVQIHIIDQENDTATLSSRKIKQEKIGVDEFDRLLLPINKEQISNIEKHQKALEYVVENKHDICWIIEDDAVVSNDYIGNLHEFLQGLESGAFDYDILFTCFSILNPNPSTLMQCCATSEYKVIPCKSSYIVKPTIARNLLLLLDVCKYNMRGMLSRFIFDNREWIKSVCMNKHLLLEASKIGMLPTSINYSNMLIYNTDYVRMIKMISSEEALDKEQTLSDIKAIKKRIGHLESADIYHVIGIIYHRLGMYDSARENMERSMEIMSEKQGYVGKYSEILNNLINIYQYNQKDVAEYGQMRSKHDIAG